MDSPRCTNLSKTIQLVDFYSCFHLTDFYLYKNDFKGMLKKGIADFYIGGIQIDKNYG